MDTTPQHWIAALRQSQDRLAARAHPLTPEDLRGPGNWQQERQVVEKFFCHSGSPPFLISKGSGWEAARKVADSNAIRGPAVLTSCERELIRTAWTWFMCRR